MISEAAAIGPDREVQPETDLPDRVLLRARDGDVAAFEVLMRRHERLVFGTAWRLLGAVEDAEDAAQEVFLRLHRHLDRLDPARPLAAWLYRVTVNVCRTIGRRRRRRRSLPLEGEAEAMADAGTNPGAATELEEEWKMVAAGLETLPARERAALTLHDLEGPDDAGSGGRPGGDGGHREDPPLPGARTAARPGSCGFRAGQGTRSAGWHWPPVSSPLSPSGNGARLATTRRERTPGFPASGRPSRHRRSRRSFRRRRRFRLPPPHHS